MSTHLLIACWWSPLSDEWPCTAGLTGVLLRAATAGACAGLAITDSVSAAMLLADSVATRMCAPPACALRAAHVAALTDGWSAAVRASARAHRHLTTVPDPSRHLEGLMFDSLEPPRKRRCNVAQQRWLLSVWTGIYASLRPVCS